MRTTQTEALLPRAHHRGWFFILLLLLCSAAGAWAQRQPGVQAIELYPFDSTQTGDVSEGGPKSYWLFAGIDEEKGVTQFNDYYAPDFGNGTMRALWPWETFGPRERVYEATTDAGLVLEYPCFVDGGAWYDPYTTARPAQRADLLGTFAGGNDTLNIVLTGRMIDPLGPADETDTIFTVKLYHEIPDGRAYVDDSGDTLTASGFTEIVVDSFAVTKGELLAGYPTVALQEYREVVHASDLRYKFNDDARSGIYHPTQVRPEDGGSRRFNLKVFWTGREKAVLRNISLRNPAAELLFGRTQRSIDYRAEVLDTGAAPEISGAEVRTFGR